MQFSRADSSLLTHWWFTVDRLLLAAVMALLVAGLVISLAASPSVAINKDLPAFYFVKRHLVFAVVSITLIFALSLQSPRAVRRTGLILYLAAVALMVCVTFWGAEINGSQRWLRVLGFSIQPSEVAKPALIVLTAWAFAEWQKRKDMPGLPIALALYGSVLGLLLVQPDIGQTALITIVWGLLFLLAGMPLYWFSGFLVTGAAGLGIAYASFGHVRARIDSFFGSGIDARSQVGQAYNSFVEGAFLGRGPGEGTIKTTLPDAHTDFIFAVIAEEYGVVACLGLVALFAFIVYRAFGRAIGEQDLAVRYGIAGLALLLGIQALINMGVNVGLVPATGMTLPMISAGGSSMIGISITLGMLLALSRRRSRLGEHRPAHHETSALQNELAPVNGDGQVPAKSQTP